MIENKNYPVKLYRFGGTHRRMGFEQGRTLRDMIRRTRELIGASEEIALIKPAWMPMELFVMIGSVKIWLEYGGDMRKYYPEQYTRLRNIARGAGVGEAYVTFLHCLEVEMNKMDFTCGGCAAGACSAAGVTGGRSASGEPVIYKNFDYPEHFTHIYTARLDEPKGRNRALCVSVAPLAGNHDGINEYGLAISYNYGYGQDKPRYNAPLTLAVQEALETCRTTAEAADYLAGCRRRGGAQMMICDAEGDLRTLEVANNQSAQRRPANGLLVNTNHYLDPEMMRIDVPPGAVYTDKTVRQLRGASCRESSEARMARLEELLGGLSSISEADLLRAFSDHGPGGEASDNTVCRHSEYFTTTCSMVFYPARRKMKVMFGSPCSGAYSEFGFD